MTDITKKVIINSVDLKKLREGAGLSLRQLEALSGVGLAYISRAENGYISMPEEIWTRLKKVLDKK